MIKPTVLVSEANATGQSLLLRGRTLFAGLTAPLGLVAIDLDSKVIREVVPKARLPFRLFDEGDAVLFTDPWGEALWRVADGPDPTVVVAGKNINHAVSHAGALTWSRGGLGPHSVRVQRAGEKKPRIVASKLGPVTSMVCDARGVAFSVNASKTQSGGVYWAPWGEAARQVAGGMRFCRRVQLVGERLWFAGEHAPMSSLWSVSVEGGDVTEHFTCFDPRGFSVDPDGSVLWASLNGDVCRRLPDGYVQKLATLGSQVSDSAYDESTVYVVLYKGRRAVYDNALVLAIPWFR